MRTFQHGFACRGAALRLKTAGLALAVFVIPAGPAVAVLPWVSIFNGTDLSGWKVPSPNPFWTVSGGVLAGQNNPVQAGSILYTLASYQNFLLETDVRWTGEIDSGIMLRKPELQLQFGVSRSLNRDMTCSFYTGSYPPTAQAQGVAELWRTDDWNTIRLHASGSIFTVWLNGVWVTEYTNASYPQSGPIGLQIHPDLPMRVEFRNLRTITAAVTDADEDGLPDAWERASWSPVRHAAAADPDRDGLSNLMEFALGTNPAVAGLLGMPVQAMELIGGENFPVLTVTRNPTAAGLSFRVEVTDDFAVWRSGVAEFVTLEDTPSRLRVRDALPLSAAARRFHRLVVTSP